MRWLQTSAAAGASVLLALAGPSLAEAPDAGRAPAPRKPYPSCPDVAPPKLPLPRGVRSYYPPGCGRGTGDCQYLMGMGSPVRVPQSEVDRYERACEAGDARLCARLGAKLAKRTRAYEPSPKDRELLQRSLRLFEKACDGGDSIGCVNLAYMHQRGYATPQDGERAVRLYQRACELKDIVGCSELSSLCGFGAHYQSLGSVLGGM